ncbi:MAG: hypothetical protein ACOX1Y_02120 [Zhaonellaceae bacterium]|jgi:hypothetical protein|nr:hypothetical protein [Clostridia bacterium]
MKLMVLVLKKHEYLEQLLSEFLGAGLGGATIIESVGMLRVIEQSRIEPPPIFGSLRQFINPEYESSRTIFMVLEDEKIETARNIINRIVGGLEKPNTGILFTIPIDYVEGGVSESK